MQCPCDGVVKASKGPPKMSRARVQSSCPGTGAALGVSYPDLNPAGQQQQSYNAFPFPLSISYSVYDHFV